MLATQVRLHDIEDAEGFVAATLQRSQIRFDQAEREELLAEGMCILFELAQRYEPHRAGYATSGRFAGYAAAFLPRRLGDAWHRRHPEHRLVLDPETGKRSWSYDSGPVSLDLDEPPILTATAMLPGDGEVQSSLVDAALERLSSWERIGVRRMIELAHDGFGWDDIADQLGVSRSRVAVMRESLGAAMHASLNEPQEVSGVHFAA